MVEYLETVPEKTMEEKEEELKLPQATDSRKKHLSHDSAGKGIDKFDIFSTDNFRIIKIFSWGKTFGFFRNVWSQKFFPQSFCVR